MDRRHLLKILTGLVGMVPLVSTSTAASTKPYHSLLILDARIAGFAYHDGPAHQDLLAAGDRLALRREPGNPHDHRAIAIYWHEQKLGYVPRHHNRALSSLMDEDEQLVAEIKRVDREAFWEPMFFTVRAVV